jgi:GGDEF domain-containing protein
MPHRTIDADANRHYFTELAQPFAGWCRGIPLLQVGMPIDKVDPMDAGTETDYFDTQTRLSRLTLGVVHDPLTGLRSRGGLLEEVSRDSSLADRIDTHISIVVTVQLPPTSSDRILALMGMRIARAIRVIDTAAHLGNGKFVVIVADADVPMPTAGRLRRSLNLPYVIDGRDVSVRCQITFARLQKDSLLPFPRASVEAAPLL